jgi:hypothetical protein
MVYNTYFKNSKNSIILEYWMMDKVEKPINSESYIFH